MKGEPKGQQKPGRPSSGDGLTKFQRRKLLILRGIIKPRCRAEAEPSSAAKEQVTK